MVKVFALMLVLSVKGTDPIPLGGRIYENIEECQTHARLASLIETTGARFGTNETKRITAYCVERELPANWREGAMYQGRMP